MCKKVLKYIQEHSFTVDFFTIKSSQRTKPPLPQIISSLRVNIRTKHSAQIIVLGVVCSKKCLYSSTSLEKGGVLISTITYVWNGSELTRNLMWTHTDVPRHSQEEVLDSKQVRSILGRLNTESPPARIRTH